MELFPSRKPRRNIFSPKFLGESQAVKPNKGQVIFCLVFVILEFELRAYTLSHSTNPFLCFFEIGCSELFAWAGFEL
jgi:hypothetical protein